MKIAEKYFSFITYAKSTIFSDLDHQKKCCLVYYIRMNLFQRHSKISNNLKKVDIERDWVIIEDRENITIVFFVNSLVAWIWRWAPIEEVWLGWSSLLTHLRFSKSSKDIRCRCRCSPQFNHVIFGANTLSGHDYISAQVDAFTNYEERKHDAYISMTSTLLFTLQSQN